ncbi:MAG: hypothetical protein V7606_3688 [Burkholderiales bacterium]
MKQRLIPKVMTVLVLGALLNACGGGGSSEGGTTGSTTLSGTAATGAAFSGATVSIIDKTGAVVGSTTTDADGKYTITLSANAVAPFVLQAVRDDLTLVSVAPAAGNSTVNITPITNLIASRLSASGDPSKLAAEMQANPDLLSSVKVNAKADEIIALLKPLLDAVGSTVNPLTGSFAANGTGLDRALDSLSITITPSSANTANIEVAIKQSLAEDAQPASIQFTNTTTPAPLPAVAESSLVETGTAPLIADLLQRMSACYALPASDRVDTPNAANATASEIKATACKDIFEGTDPTKYLNNGARVGSAAGSPFSGIYRAGVQNVAFDRGNYEFTRANGDMVISYRIASTENQTAVVRKSATDNKLRLIGNEYAYPGSVSAYHQLRSYPNQPAATYYSTGYALSVPNNGVIEKVVVTTPKQKVITLVKSAGSANLTIQKDSAPTGTSFIRVRGEYADTAMTADPAVIETTQVFDPERPSNDDIAKFAANSVWKFEYYLTADPTAVAATQYYRTLARALTIPELRVKGLATLNADVITDIQSMTNTNGVLPLSNEDESIQVEWTVPTGAIAPTSLRGFGSGPLVNSTRVRFDDGVSFAASARSAVAPCQPQSSSDNHCQVVGGKTVFANGSFLNGVDLRGFDGPGRQFSHFYATNRPLP